MSVINTVGISLGTAPVGYYDNGSKGVADSPYAIDANKGDSQKITITGNITLSVKNGIAGIDQAIKLNMVNAGSATITWDMGLDTSGGTAFSLTAAGRDIIELDSIDAFTNTDGFQAGEDMQ